MKKQDALLIQEIRQFLDADIFDHHSIPDICRRFAINRQKLQAGFLALTGCTVHAYLIRRRMEIAAGILLDSEDSIKVIALECGYKKQRSFQKTFKSTFGLTPVAYRQRHRARDDLTL